MLLKNCSNSACDGVRPSFHRFPTMSSTDAVRSIGIPLGFYSRVSAVAVPFARSVPSRDVARARADPETVPLKRRARALGISRAGVRGRDACCAAARPRATPGIKRSDVLAWKVAVVRG